MRVQKMLLAVLLTVTVVSVCAEEISLQQAEYAVNKWISQGGGFGILSGGAPVKGRTLVDPDTGAKMHLVQVPGKGFAVTSTDNGIEPIILFSSGDGGELVQEAGNPLWDILRCDLAVREAAAKEAAAKESAEETSVKLMRSVSTDAVNDANVRSPQEKWAQLLPSSKRVMLKAASNRLYKPDDMRCAPLVKTRWNQDEGRYGKYNLYTPGKLEITTVPGASDRSAPAGWVSDSLVTNEFGHYPVGCVAVAGGQLMYYWKHPKRRLPSKTVECRVDGEKRQLQFFGSNLSRDGTPLYGGYLWDIMGDAEPITGYNSENVSQFLSDIGVTCGASYSASGTAMSLYRLTRELKSTFDYQNAVHYTGSRTGSKLQEVIIPNLDSGHPVLLGIGHAHAVVADGYGFNDDESTFYLHINLGWGYYTHYWYAPPNIEKYTSIDEIVCNVFPDASGQLLSGRVTGPNGRPVGKVNVLYDGSTHGGTETDSKGIYHARISTGTYRVWAQNYSTGATSSPKSIDVAAMSESVNGNRIVNLQMSSVPTVAAISASSSSRSASSTGTTISSPTSITLSCPTSGAEIRYTLDGTLPDSDSTLYSGPIMIQDTTTLRAVAFAGGMECSETLERTWTFVDSVSRDNFVNARSLSGTEGSATFSNVDYTKETREPYHGGADGWGGASAWASWTAPANGDYTFYLSGLSSEAESINTIMSVYTGTSVSDLSLIAQNDDADSSSGDYSSRVSFSAKAGTVYKIAMDSKYSRYGSEYQGDLSLEWKEGFVHYVDLEYYSMFASGGGCDASIKVASSDNWRIMEWSDWIVPHTMSGEDGSTLAFSVSANRTGADRTGFLTVQAVDSDLKTIRVRQLAYDIVTTKIEAEEAAWRSNKRILLVRGRETCGNTSSTLFSTIPTATVKAAIDDGYVVWYSNCDRQTDSSGYTSGLGSYSLPLVCIIDPQNMSTYVARTTGYQNVSALKSFLDSNSTWSGLPASKIGIAEVTADSATITTWVRAWGTGASSATVTLEVGRDASFSSVTSTRNLGSISSLGVTQEWVVPSPATTGTSHCRIRLTSGNWSVVTDVMPFTPVAVALDSSGLYYTTGGDAPWYSVSSESHDGVDAMRSGVVSHNQSSWLQTTVTGPGTLSFRWNVSSESVSYDYLSFSIDGVQNQKIGGTNQTWAVKTVNIEEGVHVLQWKYLKDSSVSLGEDCGWLDQVSWTGATEPVYAIRFHRNDASGTVETRMFHTGAEHKLPWINSELGWATPSGCSFVGWSRSSSATSKTWSNGAIVKDLASTGGAIDLYAVWSSRPYTIRLHKNDGSGTVVMRSFSPGRDYELPWINSGLGWSSPEGCSFVGWAYSPSAISKALSNGEKVKDLGSSGSMINLYAVWTQCPYTIRFHKNDGSGTVVTRSFASGKNHTLPWINGGLGWANPLGCSIVGWSRSSTATSKIWSNGQTVKDLASAGGAIDIYAIWSPGVYMIRFHKNDGSGTVVTRSFASGKNHALPWINGGLGWTNPSGCSIVGWSRSSSATSKTWSNGQTVKDLASAGGAVDLYALWSPRIYAIRFHKNDGSGTVVTRSFASGKNLALPWINGGLGWTNPSGCSIVGWSRSSSATSKVWSNGQTVKDLASAGGAIDLYAVWSPRPYTIRFHRNDGSGTVVTRSFASGKNHALPWINGGLGWTNPSGCSIVGWSRSSSATSKTWSNGQTVKDLASAGSSVDLYVVWSRPVRSSAVFAAPSVQVESASSIGPLANPKPEFLPGYYCGELADGTGMYDLLVDEGGETGYVNIVFDDGSVLTDEVDVDILGDIIIVTDEDGEMYQLKFQKAVIFDD